MVIGEKAAIKTLLGGATFSRLTFFLLFSPSLGCLAHSTILASLPPPPLSPARSPYPHFFYSASLPIPHSPVFFRGFHLRARLIKICNYGLINDLKKSCELTSACLKRFHVASRQPSCIPTSTTSCRRPSVSPRYSLPHRFFTLHLTTPSHYPLPLLYSYASSLPRSCLVPVRQPLRPSHLDQLRWEGKIETCDGWMRTFKCDKGIRALWFKLVLSFFFNFLFSTTFRSI